MSSIVDLMFRDLEANGQLDSYNDLMVESIKGQADFCAKKIADLDTEKAEFVKKLANWQKMLGEAKGVKGKPLAEK